MEICDHIEGNLRIETVNYSRNWLFWSYTVTLRFLKMSVIWEDSGWIYRVKLGSCSRHWHINFGCRQKPNPIPSSRPLVRAYLNQGPWRRLIASDATMRRWPSRKYTWIWQRQSRFWAIWDIAVGKWNWKEIQSFHKMTTYLLFYQQKRLFTNWNFTQL